MHLIRVIYASTVTSSTHDASFLPTLMRQAQKNNEANDITGLLVFNHRFFLQALEGSRSSINELVSKLYQDTRHHQVLILRFEDIDRRFFPEWSMGFVPATAATREIMLRNTIRHDFDPYSMSGANALGFLQDMAEVGRAQRQEPRLAFA